MLCRIEIVETHARAIYARAVVNCVQVVRMCFKLCSPFCGSWVAMEPLRKELRTLRARRGMQKLRSGEHAGLSAFTLQTALLIAVLLGYFFAAGAAWLF